MLKTLIHNVATATVAVLASVYGLHVLSAGADEGFDCWATGASAAIWLLIGNLYRAAPELGLCIPYFAALSLFLGCLVVYPPWSFMLVLSKPFFSFGLALGTSAVTYLIAMAAEPA